MCNPVNEKQMMQTLGVSMERKYYLQLSKAKQEYALDIKTGKNDSTCYLLTEKIEEGIESTDKGKQDIKFTPLEY